jgi:putative glutamine amidotransferase
MVLPPLPAVGAGPVLEHIDALLLSGGPDLHPAIYGRQESPELGPTEPELDAYELMLCRAALACRKPVLGVCRGMQLLNVACGGTLHQHVPDVVGEEVEHRSPLPGVKAGHDVEILPGTMLQRIIGRESLHVNSFHHQGIDDLGRGLRVAACSADGLIEGVEGTGDSFVLGVQWHVESLTADQPRHAAIVAALVVAARGPVTQRRAAA